MPDLAMTDLATVVGTMAGTLALAVPVSYKILQLKQNGAKTHREALAAARAETMFGELKTGQADLKTTIVLALDATSKKHDEAIGVLREIRDEIREQRTRDEERRRR